ncbi:MAG TPA: BON domain-containing protein [Gammaproteobacteria bacterium]|nr:BON domain-containing protein [Gammaproteobacteria bacterium]
MKIHRLILVASLPLLLPLNACVPLVAGGAAATTVSVAHDRRTAGTVLEDQNIEIRIARALGREKELSRQSHINVTAYNGIVLLSGETPTAEFRQRAGDIARRQEKVRRVHNELIIAAPSSMMTRTSDSWITTKVKAALVNIKMQDFDPLRVKVVTENGTVFLMGLVTRAEAAAVTEQARTIKGVQRIVKLFEYID